MSVLTRAERRLLFALCGLSISVVVVMWAYSWYDLGTPDPRCVLGIPGYSPVRDSRGDIHCARDVERQE
jgi:hypothetical protein